MAERGQCLKCASPGAQPGVCLDCGQVRRGQFASREIVRGPDAWHYVKLGIAGLVLLDAGLYFGTRFLAPISVDERPVPPLISASPPPSSSDASYQTMEGYRQSVVSTLAQSMYWDDNYAGGTITVQADKSGKISVPIVRNCHFGGQIRHYARKFTSPPPPPPHEHVRMEIPLDDLKSQCYGDISPYRRLVEQVIADGGVKPEWFDSKILVTIGKTGAFLGCEPVRHGVVLNGALVCHLQQLPFPPAPQWWPEENICMELDFRPNKHHKR
ncbi:MAG: hypothetical protein K2W95_19275 [Candidatus Obscuribacterales bacterium]|nr:hypothetical protein [Candidatus Obscuribacterales bacterium]